MSRTNNVTFENVFAQNASTAIPSQPITGVSYRDDTQTAEQIETGQAYDAIYNSARYNQLFYQMTSLLADMAKNGLLPFQSGQHYLQGARVLDGGLIYIARREILATEQPYPLPSNESQVWLLYVDTDETLGGDGASDEKVPSQKATKSYADTQDGITLTSAKSYADTQDGTTLTSAKSYADTQDGTTLTSAKSYADTQDGTTLTSAKSYADNKFLPLAGTATNSTKWADYSIGNLPDTNFGRSGSGEGGGIVLVKGSSGNAINIDNYYGQLRFFGYGTGTSIKVYTLNIDNGTLNIAASKLGTSSVGGVAKPVYINAGTATACSSSVGGVAKPVYMNAGTITACSSSVGGVAKPVYMNAGTITACSSTVGSYSRPVYMNAGTVTAGYARTYSTAAASGGSSGDVWYQYI